jgi:hypothetical protein
MNQSHSIFDRDFDQELFFFRLIEVEIDIVVSFCYVELLFSIIISAHEIASFLIKFSTASASLLFDELIFSLLDEFLEILLCFVSRVNSFCEFRAH